MSKLVDNESSSTIRVGELAFVPPQNSNIGGEKAVADSDDLCLFVSHKVQFKFSRDLLYKIPYLDIVLSARFVQVQDEAGVVQLEALNPALLRPILDYIETGRTRYLFTHLSCQESVAELFRALDFLCVPPPDDETVNELQAQITGLDYLIVQPSFARILISRNDARDAVFSIALALHLNKYEDLDNHVVRIKMFLIVKFIVSHPRMFHRRIRVHFMEVVTQKLNSYMTKKQIKAIEYRYSKSNEKESASESDDDESSDEFTLKERKALSYCTFTGNSVAEDRFYRYLERGLKRDTPEKKVNNSTWGNYYDSHGDRLQAELLEQRKLDASNWTTWDSCLYSFSDSDPYERKVTDSNWGSYFDSHSDSLEAELLGQRKLDASNWTIWDSCSYSFSDIDSDERSSSGSDFDERSSSDSDFEEKSFHDSDPDEAIDSN